MKLSKPLISLLAPGILCLALSACGESSESVSFFAMDTCMTVTVTARDADEALALCESRVNELEQRLSVTLEGSELARLNSAGSGTVSDDTARLLSEALALCAETGGCFDISVSPAVAAWGFYTDEYRVPDESELAALRSRIDYRGVHIDGSSVTLGTGQRLDLGGIAKGYASEELRSLLQERGVDSALIVLGGSVEAIGSKPNGESWRIGVQDPNSGGYLGVYRLSDGCMVTSGDYQRSFERDGIRYHHILDPRTAAPAKSDLRSVTVVCDNALRADAYSTALFVMGSRRALDFWRQQGDFELILYTADGRLLLTEGLSEGFSTELPAEVISHEQ